MATITAKAIAASNNTYVGWVNGGSITFDDFTSGDKSQDAGSLLVNPSELEKIPVGSIINSVTLCYTSKVNKDQYKAGIYVTPYYLTSYTITGNIYTYTGASKAGDKIHSTQSNSTSGYDGSVPLGAWDVSKIKSGMRLAMGIDVKKSSITIIPCDLTISNIRVVIDYTPPTYIFDLNGSLDGGDPNSNISGWGTADVYINGALSSWEEKPSSGVNDFYGSFDYGTTYEVKNIVANSGYKYVGNSSYSGTLTSNTTIVLPFETKTACTITYDGNGSTSGYVEAQSGYIDDSLTLRGNSFVKEYYVSYHLNEYQNIVDDSEDKLQTSAQNSVSRADFKGWYMTESGGSEVTSPYTLDSESITLYAQWDEMSTVTTLAPTRNGYTFLGWYTERIGGTKVADSDSPYTPPYSIALYAHWKTNSTNMIYIGTKQPTFYIGTKQVQSIYLGMSLIYEVVLPKISYDSITTFENLRVPSGETSNTYTLPAANLENAEGNISYALYSDDECTTSVGTGITFDENTRQVTISNAAKDTVATQDTDKDGLAKFYVKATYESLSAIGEITLENYKVTATFSYLNKEDTYVDKITEVYYGTSVEEFANSITDFKPPQNDEICHYINNGWVDFYGESTIKSVKGDITFVLSYSSEAHDLDPNIAGYEIKEPTCTEDGYTKGYCRYCAEQEDGYKGLIQVDSPATGHTDTNDDNICDVCGESIVQIVDSGTCGDNLTYTLDSNGVLTISGTGDMQNSSFGWGKDLIKSVVINDGVTSIGRFVFSDCTGLTSVTIGNSVTSIGDWAFSGCTGLTSIIIPDSVTSIGEYAFDDTAYYNNDSNWENDVLYIGNHLIEAKNSISGAYNIKNVTKTIANRAFEYCTGLTSVTIPDSVTSIGDGAFYGCTGLTSITVSTGNPVYHSTNNCIIETETKTLISGCKNSVIPSDGSVTSIGKTAFSGCDGLTSITIPNSVTSIGDRAFESCSDLTNITVSSGNTVYHSTDNCLIETESKTLILGCKNSIIPTDGSVTSIGYRAFFGCTSLTGIMIPNSITSIGGYAFWCCYGLASVVIPDSVESIGTYAFSQCIDLTEVDFSTCTDIPTLESSNVFSNTSSSLVIKVPSALVDEWKAATNWSTYADKIVGVRL